MTGRREKMFLLFFFFFQMTPREAVEPESASSGSVHQPTPGGVWQTLPCKAHTLFWKNFGNGISMLR